MVDLAIHDLLGRDVERRADDHALLYRVDSSRWEGIADSFDPVVTRRYLNLFDTIWNASEPAPEFRQVPV